VVAKGDLLVANYLGQIWHGKVFDSSFARAQPTGFAIGVNKVISGWDKTLVGVHVGSRLLLVIPPADGYGKTGNSQAGIKGTDTLVFVVDVLAAYNDTIGASPQAAPVHTGAPGVTVTGALGTAPTITIAKTAAQPKTQTATILDRGKGPAVKPGILVMQIVADSWSGQVLQSTWTMGTPEGDPIGDKSEPSALDKLIGTPLGSRVLLEIPKNSSGGPYALVLDLVAQPTGTKSQQ
jgi:peptidylprolyl isomerase